MKRSDISAELQAAYDEIHTLTHAACFVCPNEAARLPNRCCDSIACENARKWAKLKGIDLQETGHPTLPFMGPNGCMLDITLKPLCTMHSCNPQCEEREDYRVLRQKIEELEGDWQEYLRILSGTHNDTSGAR